MDVKSTFYTEGIPGTVFKLGRDFREFLTDPTGRKRQIRTLIDRVRADSNHIEQLTIELENASLQLENSYKRSDQLSAMLNIQELAANTDELTGANNRRAFNLFIENIDTMVERKGYTGKGCLVAIDLDRFKQVNDTYGHTAGDEVLKAVVQRLEQVNLVSADTTVYRLGGDEFVLVILDKRHDEDRRIEGITLNEDNSYLPRGAERRQIPFEIYVRKVIREEIDSAASKTVPVKLGNGKKVDVDFGISEGYGYFENISKSQMLHALKEADSEAYVRKSGLDDFLANYESMDDKTKEFVDKVLGFRYDENVRGGYSIDPDIGLGALYQMDEFKVFLSNLNERALRWVFPGLNNGDLQLNQDFSR